MNQRPTSITVIAWIFIVISALNVVTSVVTFGDPMVQELMAKNPIPVPAQYALLYLGLAVMFASGAGMLNGHNWARWLYVIWGAFGSVVGLATSPMKLMMIPGILFLFVIIFFLFRPAANRYFLAGSTSDAQDM